MDKLEIGTRIRITKVPREDYPYFKVGDEAVVVSHYGDDDMWCEFDRKYRDGVWCVGEAEGTEFEVVDTGALTHAEYFHKYGKLTEERIRDLLAVYEEAKGVTVKGYVPSVEMQELIARVREIDDPAADYLASGDWLSIDAAGDRGRLHSSFSWRDTPQGFDYWYAISRKLGED